VGSILCLSLDSDAFSPKQILNPLSYFTPDRTDRLNRSSLRVSQQPIFPLQTAYKRTGICATHRDEQCKSPAEMRQRAQLLMSASSPRRTSEGIAFHEKAATNAE